MKFHYLFTLCLICTFLTSCQTNNAVPENQNNENILVEQSSYHENETFSNQEIATHLATIASEVPNVNDAIAIVAGPYAVVGIDIDATSERQQVGTIKFSVNEALRYDPYGKTTVVIADADMMQRLRDMRVKLDQGHPVQGVVDELAEIVSRVMPTFPIDEDQPQDPIDNKQNILDEEQILIEKEQTNS